MANTDIGERMALIERAVEDHVAETGMFPTTGQIIEAVDGAAGGSKTIRQLLDRLVENDRLAIGHESPGNPTVYMPQAMYNAITRNQRRPDWLTDYGFEEVDEIKNKIRKQEQQLTDYHLVESLLYGTGRSLEEAAAKALEILEFEDLKTPYQEHDSWDITLSYQGDTYVLEVKGKGKSADKDDATQLQGWLHNFVERHADVDAHRVKGGLIVNHFKHVDPKERWPDNPERPPVSAMCERYLKLNGQLFLTTPDLFEVTRRVLRGETSPDQGRKEVMSLFRTEL